MSLSLKDLKLNLSVAKKGLLEATNVGSRFWKNYWQNEISELEKLIEEESKNKGKTSKNETTEDVCSGQISFDDVEKCESKTETSQSIID